jgi:hypothetical protein
LRVFLDWHSRRPIYLNGTIDRKGKVLVTNLQPQIQQVMDIVQVLPALTVLGTEQEADEYLRKIQEDALKQQKANLLGL